MIRTKTPDTSLMWTFPQRGRNLEFPSSQE